MSAPELERIARALGGVRCGSGWLARCPAHEDRRPSLSLALGLDGRVLWHCHAGCDQRAVGERLQALGLTDARRSRIPSRAELARLRAERARLEEESRAARRARAVSAWREAGPVEPGGPVDRYLRGRGLAPADGPSWPAVLREGADRVGPIMVAAASAWPDLRKVDAVQVTRLTAEGRKRAAEPVRLTFGALGAAACWIRPPEPGRRIVLAEGVEDALAVALASRHAAAAVLGASRAGAVKLPARAEVILALDNDDAGRTAAVRAGLALQRQGHAVYVCRLPEGADPASLVNGPSGCRE